VRGSNADPDHCAYRRVCGAPGLLLAQPKSQFAFFGQAREQLQEGHLPEVMISRSKWRPPNSSPDFSVCSSQVIGSFGSANSFGLNYETGPLGIGVAYTEVKYGGAASADPLVPIRNWGVRAQYDFRNLIGAALYTTARNCASGAYVYQAEAGASWRITVALSFGANCTYMKGNEAFSNNHANQVRTALSYSLSKRPLVFAQGVYPRANSGAQAVIVGIVDGELGSATQAIARIGIQTAFCARAFAQTRL